MSKARHLKFLPALAVLLSTAAQAHTGSAQGWLHPLTGLDHLLAMVAVGAWSAQIGGRAIWTVPSVFVCCMFFGGLAGFRQVDLPYVETGVACSVLILGLAIGLSQRWPTAIAALTVGGFGVCHGYAHGYEMPVMDDKLSYVCGFLATTATLHLVGAVGGWATLRRAGGAAWLRAAGYACAACGVWLTWQAATGA